MTEHQGALQGVRVVDLTSVVAGPYATMWLADLGADVVKIEGPDGDTTRQAGHARNPGMGSVFLTLGRGKRSVCVDLKTDEGRQVALDLCVDADVFVHNVRPGALARLGLTYDDVAAVNPTIIHAALSGFDPRGPYGDRPAYDDMIQGLTGMADHLGEVTGAPAYVPGVVADKTAGLVLAMSILTALFHRERTGVGQAVNVPLFETMAAFQLTEHLWDSTYRPPVNPPGYARVLSPERKPFRTSDDWLCALPYQDKHFAALFTALERDDLLSDERFASIPSRLAHADDVYRTLGEIFATRTTGDWLELLQAIEVPAVRLGSVEDLLADEHLDAVDFFRDVTHPSEGALRLPRSPVVMTDTPPGETRPAPALGADTASVLAELGYGADRIARIVGPTQTDAPPT